MGKRPKRRKSYAELLGVTHGSKIVLLVLWVPSKNRVGEELANQDDWKERAIAMFTKLFNGATAMPPVDGAWRDPDPPNTIIRERPIMVHCYTEPVKLTHPGAMKEMGDFCRRMGLETGQGEVFLLIDSILHSFPAPSS